MRGRRKNITAAGHSDPKNKYAHLKGMVLSAFQSSPLVGSFVFVMARLSHLVGGWLRSHAQSVTRQLLPAASGGGL